MGNGYAYGISQPILFVVGIQFHLAVEEKCDMGLFVESHSPK